MIYPQLFWEFFKTGLLAVGGGLATLPFLFNISAVHPDWFTLEELGNMIAVSESTPGPIGINMATYAGFSAGGVIGSLVATLSLILPSVIVILIIARVFERFKGNPLVKDVFHCLRPVVTGVIFCVLISLATISLVADGRIELVRVILFCVVFAAAMVFKKLHPFFLIMIGAVAGIFLL